MTRKRNMTKGARCNFTLSIYTLTSVQCIGWPTITKTPIKTNLLTSQQLLSILELLCALNFANFTCILLVLIRNNFVALCSHYVDNRTKYFIMFFFSHAPIFFKNKNVQSFPQKLKNTLPFCKVTP